MHKNITRRMIVMYDIRKDISAFGEGINYEREHTRSFIERSRRLAEEKERKLIDDRIIIDFISVILALALNHALLAYDKEIWNISYIVMIWEVFKFLLNIVKRFWRR